jgi:RNA polymerase primary sigma factor
VPLLSGKQEQRLGRIMSRGAPVRAAAEALAASLGRRPSAGEVAAAAGLPSPAAAAAALAAADEARDLMVEFNMRMVFSIAKRYAGKGVDVGDLIPEGVVGLRKAIDRFDPGKGFKFSTYAHWWIRQAVSRAISDQCRDVRLPCHVVEFLMRFKKVAAALRAQPGREEAPTYRELAAAMGIPLPRLVSMLRASRSPRSPEEAADRGVGGAGGRPATADADAEAMWEGEGEDGAPDLVAEGERGEFLRETLGLMLSTLPKRERNVVRLRYGLFPPGAAAAAAAAAAEALGEGVPEEEASAGLGLRQVGATYGLSRERIRQIEADALRHLRMPWRMSVVHRARSGAPVDRDDLDKLCDAAAAAQHPWS